MTPMTYDEAVDFLHGIARFGSKPGLERVRLLLERMGNPQKKLSFVHLAGTNGKGSTSTLICQALTHAGYRTGLYISPFVTDFRERIQRNNQMIGREELAQSTALVKSHWDAMDAQGEAPSEFETLVAVAFDYFLKQQVDIVVLEVGMGGRFDATNIIDGPLVSVITSLGLDHTEYLGDTLEKIALEKCGIIKPGAITVCYPGQPSEAMKVIHRRCREEGSPLRIPTQPQWVKMDFDSTRMIADGLELLLPLAGAHQVQNAITALEALRAVGEKGFPVPNKAIQAGFAATRMPARLEVISRSPLVVLDGAHNPSGMRTLWESLRLLENRRFHLVIGMLGRKDVASALQEIPPDLVSLYAVPVPEQPGSLPPMDLARLAWPLGLHAEAYQSAEAGIQAALSACANEKDVLLVCGSLYLASAVRPLLFQLTQG